MENNENKKSFAELADEALDAASPGVLYYQTR